MTCFLPLSVYEGRAKLSEAEREEGGEMGGKLGPKLCGIYALNAVVVVVGRKKTLENKDGARK